MPREFEKPVATGGPFRLGEWLVEPSLNRLSRGDTTIQLELKVMDVLVCLAERAGEVVPRREIVDTVWATEFIADNTLTHAITELRNAFDDDARNPSFIEMIHRRGYRLIASIEAVVSDKPGISTVARSPVPESPGGIDDQRSPYPGLAAFTENDAEFFFGREAEVAQMWRKLTSRRLLAVIGPSGVGKSSFLRAGVIPAKPEGWDVVVCQPGEAPFAALARALAPEIEGDREAISKLVHLTEPGEEVSTVSRWRQQNDQALLVVDQFEELFTLNPPEVQERFAELLARLARDADVHVLLSMRDDFLYRCHDHDALMPIFSELTPVKVPAPEDLRRALVQPAAHFGNSFDDDGLADEMLETVKGERGALPMLAFAVARLWEKRDKDKKELTRSAYQAIGGVSGSLAQHAESTLTAIGQDRLPIVREIFRNLVTVEGTRATREVENLLSVFPEPQRVDAEQVLQRLIDARLVTSFEEEVVEGNAGPHRVEVVHESLLTAWPRLVRWQTQDADAAQLRDQLRQATQTWEEHDRARDYLWTGKAYREFSLWRENYPGGLTELEEGFALAMTDHAKRRKRRRRIAVAAVFVVLLAVLAVVGSFWRRSVREARRTQAANLVSLGQLELGDYPTAAMAFALASLEQADSAAARHLALKALWKGPTAFVASDVLRWHHAFTPDGRWLVMDRMTVSKNSNHLTLVGADGVAQELENVHVGSSRIYFFMGSSSQAFVSAALTDDSGWKIVLWSVAEKRPLAETRLRSSQALSGVVVNPSRRRVVILIREEERISVDVLGFDGRYERLGTLDFEVRQDGTGRRTTGASLDPRAGEWLGVFHENEAYVIDIGVHELGPPRLLGRHEGQVAYAASGPLGRFFVTAGEDGEIRLWSVDSASPPEVFQGPPGQLGAGFSSDGSLFDVVLWQEETLFSWIWRLGADPPRLLRRIDLGRSINPPSSIGRWPLRRAPTWDPLRRKVAMLGPDRTVRVWTMDSPADAEPLTLLRGNVRQVNAFSFAPEGDWLATADTMGLALWPLAEQYPVVIGRHGQRIYGLEFAPDGGWLASSSLDGTVRLWPLDGDPPPSGRILQESKVYQTGVAASPDGKSILVGTGCGSWLLPVGGDPPRKLIGFDGQTWQGAFSPGGRFAAEIGGQFLPAERVIRVWDANSWLEAAVLEFDIGERPCVTSLQFTQDGRLLSASDSGLQRWDLDTGKRELLYEGAIQRFAASANGRRVAAVVANEAQGEDSGSVVLLDLDSNTATPLDAFGGGVTTVAIDPEGTFVVTGSLGGEVRAGPLTGENPHLFLGHESTVFRVAIDPRGRWIASGGYDTTVRLWPMPDFSKPPLHTLPHNELIAKLKTLTNLRVVRDEDSPTGWKLEVGPFPGWETVPTW